MLWLFIKFIKSKRMQSKDFVILKGSERFWKRCPNIDFLLSFYKHVSSTSCIPAPYLWQELSTNIPVPALEKQPGESTLQQLGSDSIFRRWDLVGPEEVKGVEISLEWLPGPYLHKGLRVTMEKCVMMTIRGPQRAGLSAKLSPKEFLKDSAGTTSYSTANSFLSCLAMSQSMFIQWSNPCSYLPENLRENNW